MGRCVGVGVGSGVFVAVGVAVIVGVMVGPRNWPDAQLEMIQDKITKTISFGMHLMGSGLGVIIVISISDEHEAG